MSAQKKRIEFPTTPLEEYYETQPRRVEAKLNICLCRCRGCMPQLPGWGVVGQHKHCAGPLCSRVKE
jgi:hypothetical protein